MGVECTWRLVACKACISSVLLKGTAYSQVGLSYCLCHWWDQENKQQEIKKIKRCPAVICQLLSSDKAKKRGMFLLLLNIQMDASNGFFL